MKVDRVVSVVKKETDVKYLYRPKTVLFNYKSILLKTLQLWHGWYLVNASFQTVGSNSYSARRTVTPIM
jgi:hypothetical protein